MKNIQNNSNTNEESILTSKTEKILRKLAERWGEKTSDAFLRLVSEKVEVSVDKISILSIKESFSKIDNNLKVGIIFGIMGDLQGFFIILSEKKSALDVMNLVNKKEFGTILNEIDNDALGEVGNILAGNYLGALAESINMNAQASMPSVTNDFNKGFMDGFFTSLDKNLDVVLEFDSMLESKKKDIKMKIILVLNKRSFNALIG